MRLARGFCLAAGLLCCAPACAQLPGFLRRPPPVKCDWSRGALDPTAALVGKQEFIFDTREPVQIWMVRAGNRIILSGTGMGADARARVDVTAKIAETSDTFSGVCKNRRIGESSQVGMLHAHAPLGSTDVLWRIEVRTGATGARKARRPLVLTVWDVSTVREARKSGIPLHGMLCLGDIPEMELERPATHQFGGRIRLEVNAAQSTFPLSSEQQAAVSNSVLNSVALWVRACIACRLEHLIVVLVDGQVYTRASANAWLAGVMANPASGSAAEQAKALEKALQPVQMLMAGDRKDTPTGKELEQYEPLSEAGRTFLCGLETSPASQRTVDAFRRAACGVAMSGGELSKIRVRFRDGPTACGDDTNVIACRPDLELTEYNARDYRYVVPGTSQADIGAGDLEVDLQHVIAHEMGHWIGLNHIDRGQSLMSSSMENSRCIDMQTVDSLYAQGAGTGVEKFPQAFTMKRRRGRR
ncbi:matrixin family metalloprotease [Janthinobacterium sp. HH01]|uniref:matrixin family metalloprotease n=1 Tax=Janthinobacterium sp. HH01 TaxID=1198452 RepID=UPI0003481125|nr:matrixin family metalloprotease [Janthinobacterium sp. HH01]